MSRIHSVLCESARIAQREIETLVLLLTAICFFVGLNGCEKVPTFKDLAGQGAAPEGSAAAAAPAANPAATPMPLATEPEPMQPPAVDAQQVIKDFKEKPPFQRNDADMVTLLNLPAGLDEFKDLDLTASPVTDDGLKSIGKLVNLESLSLSGTKISSATLSGLTELPHLTSLSLNSCNTTPEMFASISKLVQLQVLYLEAAKVTDDDIRYLLPLTSLRELTLNHTGISDAAFKVLGDLRELEVLRVSNTSVTGAGMQFLKRKQNERGLRVFEAEQTQFGVNGMPYLRGIETLEDLSLAQAGVTGLSLQSLKGMPHLRRLVIGGNTINDGGQVAATQVLASFRKLEELHLSQMQGITDRTLGIVKGNKELKLLELNGTSATEAGGVLPLKKFLPDCEIRLQGRVY